MYCMGVTFLSVWLYLGLSKNTGATWTTAYTAGTSEAILASLAISTVFVKAQIVLNFGECDPHVVLYDSTSGLLGGHILALTKPVAISPNPVCTFKGLCLWLGGV
jgi:hypothetical protein